MYNRQTHLVAHCLPVLLVGDFGEGLGRTHVDLGGLTGEASGRGVFTLLEQICHELELRDEDRKMITLVMCVLSWWFHTKQVLAVHLTGKKNWTHNINSIQMEFNFGYCYGTKWHHTHREGK